MISREYWFSAAHRLEGHPKCGRLHGHNYKVVITVHGWVSRITGMVIDYANLDRIVKPILELVDHKYIVSFANSRAGDPYAKVAPEGDLAVIGIMNSTAECLAEWFRNQVAKELAHADVISVEVQETPRSSAYA